MGETKKMGKKTWRANKLGRPNTKLGGPVPGRPTLSAAIARIQFYLDYTIEIIEIYFPSLILTK